MTKKYSTNLPPPWLRRVWIKDELVTERRGYPFHIPMFRSEGFELTFDNPVTIIIGDNGSGKSTLLEAIAELAGFGKMGGGRDHQIFDSNPWEEDSGRSLAQFMGASWLPKMASGWFFRAESFFNLSNFLEQSAHDVGSGGPDYLSHSHGEGFMRFFRERGNRKGLFIFDEPESALSPQRQFDFIRHLVSQVAENNVQAIIATHSPILMAIPSAKLLQLDRRGLNETSFRETSHFRLYREFFVDPEGTVAAMIEESWEDNTK
jgi:predicted ATPase